MESENMDISDRREKITEKLERRHEERLAEIERKRLDDTETESKKSSIDFFYKTFQEEMSAIQAKFDETCSQDSQLSKGELTENFDTMILRVKKVQKFVSDYVSVLPSYDIHRSQEAASSLISDIQTKREEMIPKKKFAFKSRKKEKTATAKPAKAADVVEVEPEKKNVFIQDSKGFSSKSCESLELSADEIKLQDVSLSNLVSCKVVLPGYPSAVHINNLKDCTVFCGPVPGSIFVDNCEKCIFIIACQQLRVHHTQNSQFYLHVTSRAIIEDTSAVLFAPYNWNYARKEMDFKESGLNESINNWDDVDDFNWLASDKHSPNWDVLPESQRTQDWD